MGLVLVVFLVGWKMSGITGERGGICFGDGASICFGWEAGGGKGKGGTVSL